ncbi:MAG: YncE family protein [Roseibium sp.]|nr:YncE family protein [Roseibium sp.]
MTAALGHLIVSGRWDDNVAVVDIAAALRPENDGTPNAVVSRPRVTPDLDLDGDGKADARASGQPVAVAVDSKGQRAYVVCHSGPVAPEAAAAYQHGHPGLVTVLDITKALDPAHDDSLDAVVDFVSTGRTGPVGCALSPDESALLVNCGEAEGSEDGGDEVTAIDTRALRVRAGTPLVLNPDHPAQEPSGHDSPHESFGHYPNPTGIVISPLAGGVVFIGNGGFSDVSVLDLEATLSGSRNAEINRVAVETGPFGMALSPDGKLVAVASRESMSRPVEGNTVSLIDVQRAADGRSDAEVARIPVGGGSEAAPSRPFGVAFSEDGRLLVASCFRSNTISIIDVEAALAGQPAERHRLYPKAPGGGPSRPRGIAVCGKYACVIGGAKSGPRSSLVWLVDLETASIAGTVCEVGNESYFLAALPPKAT